MLSRGRSIMATERIPRLTSPFPDSGRKPFDGANVAKHLKEDIKHSAPFWCLEFGYHLFPVVPFWDVSLGF